MLQTITALLRADFKQEAAAGFPKLSRIPSTEIIKFLDYFATLVAPERKPLLDALAQAGATRLLPTPQAKRDYQELRSTNPATVRLIEALESAEYKLGVRYLGLKIAQSIPDHPQSIQVMSALSSKLKWKPRDDVRRDLLPVGDRYKLALAKSKLLRKMIDEAFTVKFAAVKAAQSGDTIYNCSLGKSTFTASFDFSGKGAQLRYAIQLATPVKLAAVSYDDLWVDNPGWDYLTEENAPRSIGLLCEQTAYLVHLAERIDAQRAIDGIASSATNQT